MNMCLVTFARSVRLFTVCSLLGLVCFRPVSARADNQPPKVALTQPAQAAVFTNPTDIQITAIAEDSDGVIQSVELFTDLGSLGVITPQPASATPVNPFQWTWKTPPAGDHKLVAKATDNEGLTSFSDSLVITVKRDSSPAPATLT